MANTHIRRNFQFSVEKLLLLLYFCKVKVQQLFTNSFGAKDTSDFRKCLARKGPTAASRYGSDHDSKILMVRTSAKGGFQKLLSGFFPLRGGVRPPFLLRVFEHDDFPLRGGMYSPIPLRKKSPQKTFFFAKKRQF